MPDIWPSIVSGVFGFVGVLTGLGWNALQAPRIERRSRENTRTVLRTSLWAELTSLAKLMEDEIEHAAEDLSQSEGRLLCEALMAKLAGLLRASNADRDTPDAFAEIGYRRRG